MTNSIRKQWMTAVAMFVAAGMIVRPSIAASTAASTEGIAVIGAYAGTWRAEITYLKTPHGAARKEANTVKNDCWRSTAFLSATT